MRRRKKLIFWRIDKRLKQKDLATILGITLAHYSNIERGVTNPSYDLLVRFRELYSNVDVIDLFEKENKTWQP